MPRNLLLLRHAKSDWDNAALTDIERPLSRRGAKTAPMMGSWMKKHDIVPDYILSSTAQRARETVLKVCHKMGVDEAQVHWDQDIYMASLDTLLSVLARLPAQAQSVLLVGHNPGLEELLLYLCGEDLPYAHNGKLLPTASLARIRLPDDWQDLAVNCGTLIGITRPREIKEFQ